MSRYTFMSRDEWAKHVRTPYGDLFDDLPQSKALADYATPDQIAAAIAALKRLYSDEGRNLQAAKRDAGPLWPPELRDISYYRLSEADRRTIDAVHRCQDARKAINATIKMLHGEWISRHVSNVTVGYTGIDAAMAPIWSRYDAAYRAEHDARQRDIEATPIDDEAWERELRRRERIEAGPLIMSSRAA